jgi:hypothetical protein
MDPNKCCESCAFRKPGSAGAADENSNRLESLICVQGAIPFWCHHKRDGTEWNWQAGIIEWTDLRPDERRVCAGWKAMVRRLFATGWRQRLSEKSSADRRALIIYQRGLAQGTLRELKKYLATEGKPAKERAKAKKALRESLLTTFSG